MFRLGAIASVCALAATAHYTWVAPALRLEVGKATKIQIGHGHHFPESEEAIRASQLDLFALAPSGARTKLTAAGAGGFVASTYTPKEAGFHRIGFVQDRGVTSRTPAGVKPGGRDVNPNATQASRTLRTAFAYASTEKGAVAGKPVGVEFEIAGELSGQVWKLQVWKQGKPAVGVPVEVFVAGAGKPAALGASGPDGRLQYTIPAGTKGPLLFSASLKDAPPAGAAYDSVNYETSLYVSW